MNYRIPIETSARHLHLCREDFDRLFGEGKDLNPLKELSQPGQYVAKERLTVTGPGGTFQNVAIIGPLRSVTQMEISVTDARRLGVPAVIRQSGDIAGTPGMTLTSEKASIQVEHGVIVAQRHIHITPSEAIHMHLEDNDEVFVIVDSNSRSLIFGNVTVRVSRNARLAMHVDTDESNAFSGVEQPYGVAVKSIGGTSSRDLNGWMQELLMGIHRR